MAARFAVFLVLAGFSATYLALFWRSLSRACIWSGLNWRPSGGHLLTGCITNFFDTLGIGSFATTTSIFKFRKMVADEWIPGTLNVGHTLPTGLQAFIDISAISVDTTTLALMIAGAVAGAWAGAGVVAELSRSAVQLGMGGALVSAAIIMLMRQFDWFPAGGEALELTGWRLVAGVLGNVIFGAISTLGVGFYAPCMTLVSLLGMNPVAAFPIMMGSSAFLMPVASARFLKERVYSPPVAAGLTLGGLPGVPIAAFLVRSLPLVALRWLVIAVVLYAAVLMLRSALAARSEEGG